MDPVATVLSALAAPHQQERLLRLHTPLGPDVLVAETLDDDIELGAPGVVAFKGGQQVLTGPQGATSNAVVPNATLKPCPQDTTAKAAGGAAYI
ncbi:hypothetical protein FE36_05465 [Xanthomonas oryzae pv. oryzicola]|uniref:hypothetical protein n=1 Tax=Xanthomonas oryzae TaxID=347 RepID=UPI000643C2A7|nr:hypothetical protein [Xanthomonas oryzae]AKK63332.1 hypothetical protein FE36_05465 [Xanthomonas oryzae pv. oryzicola]